MDVAGSRAESWYNGPLSKSQANPGLQQRVRLGRSRLVLGRHRLERLILWNASSVIKLRCREHAMQGGGGRVHGAGPAVVRNLS